MSASASAWREATTLNFLAKQALAGAHLPSNAPIFMRACASYPLPNVCRQISCRHFLSRWQRHFCVRLSTAWRVTTCKNGMAAYIYLSLSKTKTCIATCDFRFSTFKRHFYAFQTRGDRQKQEQGNRQGRQQHRHRQTDMKAVKWCVCSMAL